MKSAKTLLRAVSLAAFVSALLLAATDCEAQSLIWENQGLTDEASVPSGSTFTYNGVTVTVTWSVTTDGGLAIYPGGSGSTGGGDDYVSYESDQEGAHFGLLLLAFDNSAYDKDDFITLTVSFSTPQTGLYFSILDIDGVRNADGSGWDDMVDLVYNGSVNVRANTSLWSYADSANRTFTTDNEPAFTGWEALPTGDGGTSDYRANSNQIIGNLNVNLIGLSVSNFTITFRSTDDATGNPGGQKIGLSDLYLVPEGSSLIAGSGALAICALLAVKRRRGAKFGQTHHRSPDKYIL